MNSKLKKVLEWLISIAIAIILAIAFRYYVGAPTEVKQKSMYPTLVQGQKLWLNRWNRTTKKLPERGQIITFESPSKKKYEANEIDENNVIAQYGYEPDALLNKFFYYVLELNKTSYIKRVIALPGEHVEIKNNKVYINSEELNEDYLQDDVKTTVRGVGFNDFIVPENCIFAMGDNRPESVDCRNFGCIPLEKIEGVVTIRIWPLNLFGKI